MFSLFDQISKNIPAQVFGQISIQNFTGPDIRQKCRIEVDARIEVEYSLHPILNHKTLNMSN